MAKARTRKPDKETKRTSKPRRARPTPRWLREQQDLDEMGRRRCLMILSVLSGEKPVSDAITEAQISRQLYYQLEERALAAMLRALSPGATSEDAPAAGAIKRAQELESKVSKLEADKRRAEHLLLLTRKLVGRGPLKTTSGKKSSKVSRMRTDASSKPSTSSKSSSAKTSSASDASIPNAAGADVPSAGSES